MKYKRTYNYQIEAMPLYLNNLEEIMNWLNEHRISFTLHDEFITILLEKKRSCIAYIGDYIVIDGNMVIVYDEEYFKNNFDESEE